MQLIVESKPLAKLVSSIAERGAKLDSDIHLAACSVLAHTAAHRNKTLIGNLVEALPKSARRKALIARFGGLSGVRGASIEQLAEIPGISRELAEKIHSALN